MNVSMLEKLSKSDLIELAALQSISMTEETTKSELAALIANALTKKLAVADDSSFYSDDVDRQFIESDDVLSDLTVINAFDLMHFQVYDKLSTVRTSETCSRCAQTSLSTMTTANNVIVTKVFKKKKNDNDELVDTDKIDDVKSVYRYDDLKRRSMCNQCFLRKSTIRQYFERELVRMQNVSDFRKHAYAAYSILALRSDSLADAIQRVNLESDDMRDKLASYARAATDTAKQLVEIDESKREAALEAIASLREAQTERAAKFENRRARVAAQFAAR